MVDADVRYTCCEGVTVGQQMTFVCTLFHQLFSLISDVRTSDSEDDVLRRSHSSGTVRF